MNRRRFMTAAAAAATVPAERAASQGRILLPTDTPDELGFRIMWYNPVPPIDKSAYRLEVGGLVEKPRRFELEKLRSYPRFEQSKRLKCVQCWSARTTWEGFRFEELVEDVKPLAKATSVRIDCADKWYEYMSLDEMAEPGVMLCLEMAGQPLTDQHGAPLRPAGAVEVRIQVGQAGDQDHLCGERRRIDGVRYRAVLLPRGRDPARLRPSSGFGPEPAEEDPRRGDRRLLMLRLAKRDFLKLAGLAIAEKLVPSWAWARPAEPTESDRKVIIVTFGGGCRYQETFAPGWAAQHTEAGRAQG